MTAAPKMANPEPAWSKTEIVPLEAILMRVRDVGISGFVVIRSSQEMAFLLEPPCADDAYVNPGQGA